MTNDKAFLKQFQKSRKNVASWPKWMRDVAYMAAATFPLSPQARRVKEKS